jgi:hypothetical protein
MIQVYFEGFSNMLQEDSRSLQLPSPDGGLVEVIAILWYLEKMKIGFKKNLPLTFGENKHT